MAPHSSTLAWKIPWMEEPGRLQSMGSLRVEHDWATSLWLFTFMHWRKKWQPTPVFLPGESQGWGTWWAAVYGVTQSRTRLKWLNNSNSNVEWVPNLHQYSSILHQYSALCFLLASIFFIQEICPQLQDVIANLTSLLGCQSASSNSREGAQIPFLPSPNLLFLQSSSFQLIATLFFQSFGAKP